MHYLGLHGHMMDSVPVGVPPAVRGPHTLPRHVPGYIKTPEEFLIARVHWRVEGTSVGVFSLM